MSRDPMTSHQRTPCSASQSFSIRHCSLRFEDIKTPVCGPGNLLDSVDFVSWKSCNFGLLAEFDPFGWADLALKRPAKSRVILNPDDTRKLILPHGIPESMEYLMDEVRKVCGLNGNLGLQYQDRDFGDALVNLTSTVELEDLATIKVIPITHDCSQVITLTVCDDIVSAQSDVVKMHLLALYHA